MDLVEQRIDETILLQNFWIWKFLVDDEMTWNTKTVEVVVVVVVAVVVSHHHVCLLKRM